MSKTEYNCNDCVNKGTPICKACEYVTSNGRVLQKPKYFAGGDYRKGMMEEASKQKKARAKIFTKGVRARMRKGLPIPLLPIMLYNQTVAMEYKEDE